MKNRRRIILIVVGLLLIPFNLFIPDVSAASLPVSDGEVPVDGSTLDWNETLSQLCINLSDSDGDGMEYIISQNSVVLESEGEHIYTNNTHNFTDTINNSASWESAKGRVTSGTAFTGTTEFTSGEYTNITNINISGVNTSDCSPSIWSHHNFSFNLSSYVIHNITGLEVRWHGYGGYYTGGAKPKWNWGTTMYFDTDGSGWYTADSTTPYTTDGYSPVLEWLNYSAHHEMSDWIDANGFLNVAVEHTSTVDCSVIYTDYIELVVTVISGGVGNGTYCTSNVSWWNDTCGTDWSWVVYTDDGRDGSSSTTYTFTNAPCTFSGTVYPINEATDVCPCCDYIGIDVTVGYNFNMTVYGREQGNTEFHIWNHYENINADEYYFCMDTITPTEIPHGVALSNVAQPIRVINTWQNINFTRSSGKNIDINNCGFIFTHSGFYHVFYRVTVRSSENNPTGDRVAVRALVNELTEVNGSYEEIELGPVKGREWQMSSFFLRDFLVDDTLCFQAIADDVDISIIENGTWSMYNYSFYVMLNALEIEEQHPLMYNTTYEWYVNVSKYDNSSLFNQTSVFSFTTAVDPDDCVSDDGGGGMRDRDSVLGVIGLVGLFGFLGYFLNRRRKNNNNNNNNNIRRY